MSVTSRKFAIGCWRRRRGPVPALGAHVAGDPLRRGAQPGLGGGSGHVREAGLLQERLRGLVVAAQGC